MKATDKRAQGARGSERAIASTAVDLNAELHFSLPKNYLHMKKHLQSKLEREGELEKYIKILWDKIINKINEYGKKD